METKVKTACIVSVDDLAVALWNLDEGKKIEIGIDKFDMPSLVSAIADAARGAKILAELGIDGAYYVKEYGGKSYIIIEGYAGLRGYLGGTRYLTNNPKVLQIGLRPLSDLSAVKANFILSMTLYTATDIVSYISGDGITLSQIMGNAVFNAASTALSIVGSMAAVALVGSFTTMVVPAVAAGIVVGAGVTVFMNALNDYLDLAKNISQIFEKVIEAFNESRFPANTPVTFQRHSEQSGANPVVPDVRDPPARAPDPRLPGPAADPADPPGGPPDVGDDGPNEGDEGGDPAGGNDDFIVIDKDEVTGRVIDRTATEVNAEDDQDEGPPVNGSN